VMELKVYPSCIKKEGGGGVKGCVKQNRCEIAWNHVKFCDVKTLSRNGAGESLFWVTQTEELGRTGKNFTLRCKPKQRTLPRQKTQNQMNQINLGH